MSRPFHRLRRGVGLGAVAIAALAAAPPAPALQTERLEWRRVAAGAHGEAVTALAVDPHGGSLAVGDARGLRFVLLGAGVGLALYVGAHPVGLVIGLSLIVPATLIAAWMARPEPAPATPAPPPDDPSWDDWNPWLARVREPDDEEDQ